MLICHGRFSNAKLHVKLLNLISDGDLALNIF